MWGMPEVEDQQVDALTAGRLERGGTVGHGLDLVALELEGTGDGLPDRPIVLREDQMRCRHGPHPDRRPVRRR